MRAAAGSGSPSGADTVRGADQVLVVNDGRVIERGTHETLLAAGGEYARMYTEFLREG